jgi:hypothetical protein
MSKPETDAMMGEFFAFTNDIKQNGQYQAGEALQPVAPATTVRVRNGKISSTDRPFAESRGQLGGFYLISARDLNEAIQNCLPHSLGTHREHRSLPRRGVQPLATMDAVPGGNV